MISVRTVPRRPLRHGYWKLREALSGSRFDERFYLDSYADVAAAVRQGLFSTAFEHWIEFGAAEGRLAAAPVDGPLRRLDPLQAPTTVMVYLELTTRCNLRCVYCPVSQPTYRADDLPLERLDPFIEEMHARGVQIIVMNGHGESSIVKGWEALSDRLADAGFRLHITTNLAKRLTPPEIAALSRFESILVSLDTADAELLAALRRGARLQTILENIEAIAGFAKERRRTPELALSCVVSDQSAPRLRELVTAMLERGVRVFRFGDLVEYDPIPGAMVARHVSTLPPDALASAGRELRAALEQIAERNGTVFVDPPISALLVDDDAEEVFADARSGGAMAKTVHYDEPGEGMTRDCLDPWRIAFVQATGDVRPCCFFEETLGSLAVESLEDIVDGEPFRELREELLTGALRPNCLHCNARPLVDAKAFSAKVTGHLESERARISR
ncbi:MAG TPA: radical SAM protein [Thermoanaerobaculia bacterium]|nr:radical SAM protein [Thermoanaerobaculia bacterium]